MFQVNLLSTMLLGILLLPKLRASITSAWTPHLSVVTSGAHLGQTLCDKELGNPLQAFNTDQGYNQTRQYSIPKLFIIYTT